MNFINKIGQRNFTKYIVFVSILISITIYGLKFYGVGVSNVIPDIAAIIIGTILFCFSNILFSLSAHKSKHYRLLSLHSSLLILIFNSSLFILSLYYIQFTKILALICIVEIVFALFFYFMVKRDENKRRNTKKVRRTMNVTKTTNTTNYIEDTKNKEK